MTQRKVALVCRVDRVVTEKREMVDDQACRDLRESVVTRAKSEAVAQTVDLE